MWTNIKSLLMLCIVQHLLISIAWSKPAVEIERQRLLDLSAHGRLKPTSNNNEPSVDTKRILDEIHRINMELGYIKKPVAPVRPRFNPEGYFYPRPPYHPLNQRYIHNDYNINNEHARFYHHQPREISSSIPFHTNSFYSPTQYLQLPNENNYFTPTISSIDQTQDELSEYRTITDDMLLSMSPPPASEYAPKDYIYQNNNNNNNVKESESLNRGKSMTMPELFNNEKTNVITSVKKIVTEMHNGDSGILNIHPMENAVLLDLPKYRQEIKSLKQPNHYNHENLMKGNTLQPISLPIQSIQEISEARSASPAVHKKHVVHQSTSTAPMASGIHSKTFYRPTGKPIVSKIVASTKKPSQSEQTQSEKATKAEEDYDDELTSAEDDEPSEAELKGPFSSYFTNQKEQVVEALKQGGIIIQRLRVREGGIAIAGPNGVATAGSGGTAIVGPGGIALTHPRSLAIAGPGARVIAVPETTNLQELAMRTNARQLPVEGIVVATGPVVYYNPAVPNNKKQLLKPTPVIRA